MSFTLQLTDEATGETVHHIDGLESPKAAVFALAVEAAGLPAVEMGEARRDLTPREVGGEIGLTEGTLANWRSFGSGPPWYKSGGSVRYPRAGFEQWKRERGRG